MGFPRLQHCTSDLQSPNLQNADLQTADVQTHNLVIPSGSEESAFVRLQPTARSRSLVRLVFVAAIFAACMPAAYAQRGPDTPPNLAGVYWSIPNGATLPGGLKNSGSPAEIPLLPKAAQQMRTVSPKDDPWRACQPVGQFRMMAREGTKVELAPVKGMLVMLYEDVAHGLMRTIYLNRGHIEGPVAAPDPNIEASKGTWFGDQVGRWEGDTLVIDGTGLNTRTWLNDAGAQHSEALHLVERIRPIRGGQYLEYKMTVEDPMALAKPYTYTRYFEKLNSEIEEDICHDEE
jgi:hypothetical protein